MIKIGVLDVDGISGALNILSTEGQRDFVGIECERLSLLIPHVSYTIPEIILVTVFNIDIRQWPIEVGVTEVYSLFQSWFITYDFINACLYIFEGKFDIMVAGDKGYMSSCLGDEVLKCIKERAMSIDYSL